MLFYFLDILLLIKCRRFLNVPIQIAKFIQEHNVEKDSFEKEVYAWNCMKKERK